jgi:hypothetical protein
MLKGNNIIKIEMKNFLLTLTAFMFTVFIVQQSHAEKHVYDEEVKTIKSTAAGCPAGAGFAFLDINNVRVRINTGGDMWWNFDRGQYYIPANTQKTSMFSASLWIGGLDVNGQLKLAAQRYRRTGVDYWPGPLSLVDASIDEEDCSKYDRMFEMSRAIIDEYLAWWNSDNRSEEFPSYTIPEEILNWPAHGDITKGQSYYLAPFYDNDGDGNYDPTQGDYPYYDIDNSLCRTQTPTMEAAFYHPDDPNNWKYGILADQVIKGDQTLWWVFNDKGNIHTETNGAAVGMEIRGQAFAFATNDEVNNMTFYSYEIINRSTFTLTETYFSQWVDPDLGYAWDDYTGCDVSRGLGYVYNGFPIDGSGETEAYGEQPPAIGVDFFQGPYMDPDQTDNPKYTFVTNAQGDTIDQIQICDFSINGVNFGDGIVDNERFGMRRFVYHNNTSPNPATTDPDFAPEYYNYLRGIWKDNTKMVYGGTAHVSDANAVGPETNFMFPGDTDPCNWGTGGEPPNDGYNQDGKYWTEETQGNQPGDRRFMQSAGPFTLDPGAVNYITVGIPWARATTGGAWASVELLRVVDDKAQALFDNCFKVLDGPDAPDLTFLELDRKLVTFISNRRGSNNFNEAYAEIDPNIQLLEDSIPLPQHVEDSLRTYTFEGYQIFQLRYPEVTVESLDDPDLARLVAQFDIKNGITKLVNFYFDASVGASVPVVEVVGGDEGIEHSFEITQDAFADKDPKLVNNKQYYYLALAYAFNEYAPYTEEPGIIDGLYGQKLPYLAGRRNIKTYTAIPHKPVGGIVLNAEYGDGFEITRLQGKGNARIALELTDASISEVLSKPPIEYEAFLEGPFSINILNNQLVPVTKFGDENYPIVYNPTYKKGEGPLRLKVIDPLNIVPGKFKVELFNVQMPFTISGTDTIYDTLSINRARWRITDENGNLWVSDTTIDRRNEQVIPELGLSLNFEQRYSPGDSLSSNNGVIRSDILYTDSSRMWYSGVPDMDVPSSPMNWIRAGTYKDGSSPYNDWNMSADEPLDAGQDYEKLISMSVRIFGEELAGGTWAPFPLVATKINMDYGHGPAPTGSKPTTLKDLHSIDVVLTSDKSLWTRCPVIETCPDEMLAEGNAPQYTLRRAPSVDKDGNFADPDAEASMNPEDPNYISATGMGWFPGYAINVETGERLNVMFGENSWLSGDNGRDMQWNPTSKVVNETNFAPVFGGMHYLYIMNNQTVTFGSGANTFKFNFPAYDAGTKLYHTFNIHPDSLPMSTVVLPAIYQSCQYVNIPLSVEGEEWLPEGNDATIKIRVERPFQRYMSSALEPDNEMNLNNFNPVFEFETDGMEAIEFVAEQNDKHLDLINVVPNPYYAYADGPGYERNQLDTRVKITNLPPRCVVTIYSMNGTLIRQYNVDKEGVTNPRASTRGDETDSRTSIDWDLKNFAGIPIAGGLYLIHVKETGGRGGERVVKWFGTLRPIDLNTF